MPASASAAAVDGLVSALGTDPRPEEAGNFLQAQALRDVSLTPSEFPRRSVALEGLRRVRVNDGASNSNLSKNDELVAAAACRGGDSVELLAAVGSAEAASVKCGCRTGE